MMACIVVTDAKKNDQKITTLLIVLPASIASSLSIALVDWPYARLAGFLTVTFMAVSVRRFGTRYIGLGVITCMAYFATLFFPFHASDIQIVVVTVFISVLISYAARFWVLPDRTSRVLSLYVKAFDIGINNTLPTMANALRFSSAQNALE
ncbi:MAG: hypothetical protein H7249_01215 [Chitinophagaceae bacterium]|nr:hypothetical protein [Oligoflexus sp.]